MASEAAGKGVMRWWVRSHVRRMRFSCCIGINSIQINILVHIFFFRKYPSHDSLSFSWYISNLSDYMVGILSGFSVWVTFRIYIMPPRELINILKLRTKAHYYLFYVICHMFVAAVHCCVVNISAGIIDRLILDPVQKMMQCTAGL